MTGPRVAVFGLFGRTNLGNEATLAAFLHNLRCRLPDVAVTCIAPRDSRVSAMHGLPLIDLEPLPIRQMLWRVPRLPLRPWVTAAVQLLSEPRRRRAAINQLSGFDALVIPGTGVLDDFGQRALDLPHHLLRWCEAARRANIPTLFLSVGAERLNGRLMRHFLRNALNTSAYRSYRDEASRRHAADAGVTVDADAVYPDLAFSLPLDAWHPLPPIEWPPRRVGLGVMGYYGWNKTGSDAKAIYETYLEKVKRSITWLLGHGYSVRLLTGDTFAEERPIRDLVATFGANVVVEPIASFQDLISQILQTDIVIGSRFHNVLLALLLERPVISIGYSLKTRALLETFGVSPLGKPIETFEVDWLQAQFDGLGQLPSPTPSIRLKNRELRQRLNEQYDIVCRSFDTTLNAKHVV